MRNPFKKKPVPKTFEQEVKESAERAVKKISDFTDTLKKMKDQERTSKQIKEAFENLDNAKLETQFLKPITFNEEVNPEEFQKLKDA